MRFNYPHNSFQYLPILLAILLATLSIVFSRIKISFRCLCAFVRTNNEKSLAYGKYYVEVDNARTLTTEGLVQTRMSIEDFRNPADVEP